MATELSSSPKYIEPLYSLAHLGWLYMLMLLMSFVDLGSGLEVVIPVSLLMYTLADGTISSSLSLPADKFDVKYICSEVYKT